MTFNFVLHICTIKKVKQSYDLRRGFVKSRIVLLVEKGRVLHLIFKLLIIS